MKELMESYKKLGTDDGQFDVIFWQKQGEEAIFRAVSEMISDTQLLRGENVIEPRLQKSVESFRKK